MTVQKFEGKLIELHDSTGEVKKTIDVYSVGNFVMKNAAGTDENSAEGHTTKKVARVVYDYAVDGGAIGSINLGAIIPDKAIITRTFYDVITTFTTAGADAGTIALTSEGAGDIKAAIAVSDAGNPWDAGRHDGIQAGAVANFIKTTAARQLVLTIAGQVVTAGKLVLFAEYIVSA